MIDVLMCKSLITVHAKQEMMNIYCDSSAAKQQFVEAFSFPKMVKIVLINKQFVKKILQKRAKLNKNSNKSKERDRTFCDKPSSYLENLNQLSSRTTMQVDHGTVNSILGW